jgi:hypothetical protein
VATADCGVVALKLRPLEKVRQASAWTASGLRRERKTQKRIARSFM